MFSPTIKGLGKYYENKNVLQNNYLYFIFTVHSM